MVSVLRLEALYAASTSPDETWNVSLAALWSSVEINTGIVCSCLPTLKACATRVFSGIFNSENRSFNRTAPSAVHESRQWTPPSKAGLKVSHASLSRGLSGTGEPTQHSSVGRAIPRERNDSRMYEMVGMGRTIHVTTVVDQAYTRPHHEFGSTHELVN